MGEANGSKLLSPSILDTRPWDIELEPPALLPPGPTQHPVLGNPRVREGFPPQYLFYLLHFLLLMQENVTSGPGNRVEIGQSKSRYVFFGDAGDGKSHLPTSSYDCQGQSDTEAHGPQESPLNSIWNFKRRSRYLWRSQGHLCSERKPPSFFPCFIHLLSQLFANTEHLLCAQHILR